MTRATLNAVYVSGRMKISIYCLALLGASLVMAAEAPPQSETRRLLSEGLFAEQIDGDLERAAGLYATAVAAHAAERGVAATALFRWAELRAKKGEQKEARALMQRLISEYPEQDALLKVARERLAGGGASTVTAGTIDFNSAGTVLNVAPSTPEISIEERTAMSDAQQMVANSPDLLNAEKSSGDTPLEEAVQKGWVQLATFLLDHGAAVNGRGGPWIPLHMAASSGHKRMVELLLARGADVNAPGRAGWTALHAAVANRRMEVARLLLGKRANPNAEVSALTLKDYRVEDRTPLLIAVRASDHKMVELLLEGGADPKQADSFTGLTPLICAADVDAAAIATLLLDRADVNAASKRGETPLLAAIGNTNVPLAKLLLSKGADVRAQDAEGQSPLHVAVRVSIELVRLLLEAGAPPNVPDEDNLTPLHRLLAAPTTLASGGRLPEPGVRSNERPPPLSPEIAKGYRDALIQGAELLLAKGAAIDAVDEGGRTPLWLAIATATVPEDVVVWLVEHGASLDLANTLADSPLRGAPTERTLALERRLVIPKAVGRPSITAFARRTNQQAQEPLSVTQEAEFDAPPSLVELLNDAHTRGLLQNRQVTVEIYRATPDGSVAQAARQIIFFADMKPREWPELRWGDALLLIDGSPSENTTIFPGERSQLSRSHPKRTVRFTLGPRTTTLAFGGALDKARDTRAWTPREGFILAQRSFSAMVAAMVEAEPRAQLESVKLTRTVNGERREWTIDVRAANPEEAERASDGQPSAVKRIPARFGTDDELTITLRPPTDAEALALRRAGIFRVAPGRTFGDRIFSKPAEGSERHTLAEVIAQAYVNPLVIPAPDFSNVAIHRLKDDRSEERIEVNLVPKIVQHETDGQIGYWGKELDVPVEWGDVIEILQVPKVDPEGWDSLETSVQSYLKLMVSRNVQVTINGRPSNDVTLSPIFAKLARRLHETDVMHFDLAPQQTPPRPVQRIRPAGPAPSPNPKIASPFRALVVLAERAIALSAVIDLTLHREGEPPRKFDAAALERHDPWLQHGDRLEIRSL